jgi:TPM domain
MGIPAKNEHRPWRGSTRLRSNSLRLEASNQSAAIVSGDQWGFFRLNCERIRAAAEWLAARFAPTTCVSALLLVLLGCEWKGIHAGYSSVKNPGEQNFRHWERPGRTESQMNLRRTIPAFGIAWMVLAVISITLADDLKNLRPTGYVTDLAGVIKPQTKAQLEALSTELEQKTGAQLAIVTVKSLDGNDVQTYANDLFK